MSAGLTMVLLAMLAVSFVGCQTFQYNRGWTNGKRAETDSLPIAGVTFGLKESNENRMSDLLARNDQLKPKALFRSNDAEEVCRVPCEFLEVLRQRLRRDKVSFGGNAYMRAAAPTLERSGTDY